MHCAYPILTKKGTWNRGWKSCTLNFTGHALQSSVVHAYAVLWNIVRPCHVCEWYGGRGRVVYNFESHCTRAPKDDESQTHVYTHTHTPTHTRTHTHTRKWYEVVWPNGQTPPLESGSGLFGGSTQVHCTTASETHARKTTDTGPCKCWFLLLSPGYHLKFKLQNMEKYNH